MKEVIEALYIIINAAQDAFDILKGVIFGCCGIFIIWYVAMRWNWLLAVVLFALIPLVGGLYAAFTYWQAFEDGDLKIEFVNHKDDTGKGDE